MEKLIKMASVAAALKFTLGFTTQINNRIV
ncbi:hypothetical protein M2370_005249 [Bacillus sp. JUb91]|nr:hypothetical protein [Bacillus sp. JUb91]